MTALVRQEPRGVEMNPVGVALRLLEEDFNGLVEVLGGFVRPTIVDVSCLRLVAGVLCFNGRGNGRELG